MNVETSQPSWLRTTVVVLLYSATVPAAESPANRGLAAPPFPQWPEVVLAKPKGNEAESAKYWQDRVAVLIDLAGKADTSQKKAEFLLAAANVILGRELEPFTTRVAVGLAGQEAGSPQAIVDRAEKLLGESRTVLGTLEPADPRLGQALEVLETFATAAKVLLVEGYAAERRKTASSLAPVLEHADKSVSEAARLWQVLLRANENDPSAALQILENPMTSPTPESWPYGLFAKVLRCRYQALQGSWSAALVMLSHVEEQLEEWVPQLEHRGDARRLFAYVRLEILKRWHDAIPATQDQERAWCSGQAEQVIREYFSVETSIIRLDPAVPMLFGDDVLKAGDPKPENEKH